MTRKRYPQFHSRRPMANNTIKVCDVIGCNQIAKAVVWVEFSYMRGEDECVSLCDPHADRAAQDVEGLCVSVPPEAWK